QQAVAALPALTLTIHQHLHPRNPIKDVPLVGLEAARAVVGRHRADVSMDWFLITDAAEVTILKQCHRFAPLHTKRPPLSERPSQKICSCFTQEKTAPVEGGLCNLLLL